MGKNGSYKILALVASTHALTHMIQNSIPVLFNIISIEFGLAAAQLGLLLSAYQASSGLPQFVVGLLQRRMARKVLLATGVVWNSLMTAAGALAAGFGQFLVFRLLAGIGASTQHPVGSSMLAENFESNRGTVMGMNITLAQFGSVFAASISAYAAIMFGWRYALLAFAIPGMLLGLAIFLVREKGEPRVEARESFSTYRNVLTGILKTRPILSLIILETVVAFRFGAISFVPLYLVRSLGFDLLTSANLYAILLFGSVLGPTVLGFLSDRYGRKTVLFVALCTSSAMTFALPNIIAPIVLVFFLPFFGLTYQSMSAIIQSALADFSNPKMIDVVFGVFYTIAFGVGIVGPIAFGVIADWLGYNYAFYYVSIVTAIAIVPALMVPRRVEKDLAYN